MDESALYKLRATIDGLRTDATVLLIRAQHETMKAHVRTAQRDLTDALTLLEHERHTKAQSLLIGVLERAIQSATVHLELVELALRTHGPDASDLD